MKMNLWYIRTGACIVFLLLPLLLRAQTTPPDSTLSLNERLDYLLGRHEAEHQSRPKDRLALYPNKAYGEFNVLVTQSDTEGYIYSYTIKNAEESEQVLESFSIYLKDISFSNPNKTINGPNDKKWYIDGITVSGTLTGSAASRFIELPPENGLAPGEQMEISFSSEGPPAINEFYTRGFVEPFTDELIDSLFEAGYTEEEIFIDWQDESFKGYTISPKVWPEEVNTEVFLDTLQSYLTFSCDTIWIENNGICNSLEVKLDNVEKQLQSGNKKTASNNLQALLNELNALKEKQISSEAYALLYFNGEYLLNKLQPTED